MHRGKFVLISPSPTWFLVSFITLAKPTTPPSVVNCNTNDYPIPVMLCSHSNAVTVLMHYNDSIGVPLSALGGWTCTSNVIYLEKHFRISRVTRFIRHFIVYIILPTLINISLSGLLWYYEKVCPKFATRVFKLAGINNSLHYGSQNVFGRTFQS